MWSHPPSQVLLWGTLGPALDKLLEPGQVLAGTLAYAFQPWCGQPKSTCALVEYGTASGLVHSQPKPGSQFSVLIRPGWGSKWRRFFLQWYLVAMWLHGHHTNTHTHTDRILALSYRLDVNPFTNGLLIYTVLSIQCNFIGKLQKQWFEADKLATPTKPLLPCSHNVFFPVIKQFV